MTLWNNKDDKNERTWHTEVDVNNAGGDAREYIITIVNEAFNYLTKQEGARGFGNKKPIVVC